MWLNLKTQGESCAFFREKLAESFVVTEIITTFAIGSEEKYRAIMHRYYFAHSQEKPRKLKLV